MKYSLILLISLSVIDTNAQRIQYLNGLYENEYCEFDYDTRGRCRKISECLQEFESYRKNRTILKVCSYSGNFQNHLICCREVEDEIRKMHVVHQDTRPYVSEEVAEKVDYFNFESCRDGLLKHQKGTINTNHFGHAMMNGILEINDENCEILSRLNRETDKNSQNKFYCRKDIRNNYILDTTQKQTMPIINLVGDRPNMAAIGWRKDHGSIEYKCFGSIITKRFIVTAAHCELREGKLPNVVRLGDRYLMTQKDDEYAQQVEIEEFIIHPSYMATQDYDDIALIKTARKITFNQHVVPSCIGDFDRKTRNIPGITVSGYGEEEDEIPLNVLMEIEVQILSNEECNKIYGKDPQLPHGIIKSQFCVKSKVNRNSLPEACFGDSGSPLQYKSYHDVLHDDFNQTYLSTRYETSTIIGIESFGTSCGLDVPSVYTRISYYRDWIKSVIGS